MGGKPDDGVAGVVSTESSEVASLARGPSGCILSEVLVVKDIDISKVENIGKGRTGLAFDRTCFVKGAGLRDWKWR